jgi:hypothetical protein
VTDTRPLLDVRREIARTLTPVTPLPSPGRRALPFIAVGWALLLIVVTIWGVRGDASALGVARLWVLSLLQLVVGVSLFRRVLTESIPGRSSGRGRLAVWAGLGVAAMLAITAVTFAASPTYVPPLRNAHYLYACSTRTFALGLPPLALATWLLGRGLMLRPVVLGGLAGLGAGLLADASWRTWCEVSDPHHVLGAHAMGVLALCALGAVVGIVLDWRRRRTRSNSMDQRT